MILPDKVEKHIYQFQRQGAEFLASRVNALLADEMGIGKTLQALCAMNQAPVNALIICPASVKYNWAREIRDWGFNWSTQIIDTAKDELQGKQVTIINYEQIIKKPRRLELMNQRYTHLICDEIHYCKSYESQRTEAILGVNGLKNKAARRWGLTGTPVLNRPVELYPILRSFCPEKLGKYSNWMRYTKRYCQGHMGFWGYNATGASNLAELTEMLSGFMLRRLKKDVMSQLPDKTFEKVLVHLQTKKDMTPVDNASRPEIGMAKIPAAVAHIKDLLESKEKIVVFGYHRDVMQELKNKLVQFKPVLVYGGMDARAKHDAVQQFVKDRECRLFLGNILAAGTGIDGLQKVADTAVFVEMVYTPGTLYQACDRLHREGQKNNVLIQFMVIEDSVDEEMITTLIGKEVIINKITRDAKKPLRFTIQKPNNKKENKMSNLNDVLNAFLDALADRVAEKLKDKGPLVKMPDTMLDPEPERIAPEDQVELSPAEIEDIVEDKPKRTRKPKETPEKETKEKDATVEEIGEIRGLMAQFLNHLATKDGALKKQKMSQAIAARLKSEIGGYSTAGLSQEKLNAYRTILIQEFIIQFGGETWANIQQ